MPNYRFWPGMRPGVSGWQLVTYCLGYSTPPQLRRSQEPRPANVLTGHPRQYQGILAVTVCLATTAIPVLIGLNSTTVLSA